MNATELKLMNEWLDENPVEHKDEPLPKKEEIKQKPLATLADFFPLIQLS